MKLQTDSEAIGSLTDQATYLYMAMEGEPQTRICYWVENVAGTSGFTPIALLAQAEVIFSDPNARQNAHTRLTKMMQGKNEPFHQFLPKFETELAKAGGTAWDTAVQINYLNNVVNETLAYAIVTARVPKTSFYEYKNGILEIDAGFQSLKPRLNARPPITSSNPQQRPAQEKANRDAMEWEPTKANSTTRVPREEVQRRRDNNQCIKCGKGGHFARECKTGWQYRREQPTQAQEASISTESDSEELKG